MGSPCSPADGRGSGQPRSATDVTAVATQGGLYWIPKGSMVSSVVGQVPADRSACSKSSDDTMHPKLHSGYASMQRMPFDDRGKVPR